MPPRLAEQIAAEEGCRLATARRAIMIDAFAMSGKSPAYAADALHLKVSTIASYCKRFGIVWQ